MKCKTCQKEIDADYNMCPYCGEPVIPDDAVNQITAEAEPDSSGAAAAEISASKFEGKTENLQKQKKSSKKKGIILAIVILFIIIAGAAGYYFLYLFPAQSVEDVNLTQSSQKIEAANEIDPLTLVTLSEKDAKKFTLSVKESSIKANVPGEYSVIYTITSNKDNTSKDQEFNFTVVDTTPPEIRILSDEPIKIILGEKADITYFTNAVDIVDGVLSLHDVKIEGTVDFNKLGTYPLTLSASDKLGNKATKIVNVVVEERGVTYDLIKNIEGYWRNETTEALCGFSLYNGYYLIEIYSPNDSGSGFLTSVETNTENKIMKFNFNFSTSIQIAWEKVSYSAIEKKTFIVDTGVPYDDKISIDIGDGKGFQEYRYTGTQTE